MLHHCLFVISNHTHYDLVWVNGRWRDSEQRREHREVNETKRTGKKDVDPQLPKKDIGTQLTVV